MRPFDANGAFYPVGEHGSLRRRAVRSVGVTMASQAVVFTTQLASVLVLARLLAPSDFGIVTMVTTFSIVLMSFGANGYSEAIMQREEMTESLASNLFWINIGVGIIFTLIFAAAGSLLAKFYHNQLVAPVAVAMSLTIIVASTSVVHLGLLKRALRFSATSTNDIVAGLGSAGISIILALRGWAYWALVAGAVAKPLLQSIGGWCLCRWIPKLPRRVEATGAVMRFAAHVYGRFSFNYFTRNTDNLLVGWRFGPASLGFYKKAYDLFVLPANQLIVPIADVVLSTLSRLERGSAAFRRYFLNGLSILAFGGMAVCGILTLAGRDLIRILLGAKWGPAGEIFTYFGPGIGIMLISAASGLLHLSIGRADRWFKWVVMEFAITVCFFVIGSQWGPIGVASAWTVSFWVLFLPSFWYAGRPIHFGLGPVVSTIWRYIVAALVAGGSSAAISREFAFFQASLATSGILLRIVTISLLYLVLYIGTVVLLSGGPQPLYRFAELLPDLLPGIKRRQAVEAAASVATNAEQQGIPSESDRFKPDPAVVAEGSE